MADLICPTEADVVIYMNQIWSTAPEMVSCNEHRHSAVQTMGNNYKTAFSLHVVKGVMWSMTMSATQCVK